jgi:hypothetical protein
MMKRYHCKYPVNLSQEQRRLLEAMVQTSRTPAKHYIVARVLLIKPRHGWWVSRHFDEE